MNSIDKHISQKLAQRIAEAAKKMNVKLPESEYWGCCDYENNKCGLFKNPTSEAECYPAYDCPELGEMLKVTEKIDLGWGAHTEWNNVWKHWCCFLINGESEEEHQEEHKNEAESRGLMLEYLILNKLLK